jgi:Outer membrane protein transport protein (OMPP1/FadL/TodX)/Bacterial regulatory protein, Fis family
MGLVADYGDSWAGRYFIEKAALVTVNFNPVVSYRVTDWLSIGGGMSVVGGSFSSEAAINNINPTLGDDWPGNIRELRNILERAVILSPGSALLLDDLDDNRSAAIVPPVVAWRSRTLADVERDHILGVLEALEWRVRGPGNAAEELGLNASTLYSRMKKLGIRRAIPRARPPWPRPHPGRCPEAPRSDIGQKGGER